MKPDNTITYHGEYWTGDRWTAHALEAKTFFQEEAELEVVRLRNQVRLPFIIGTFEGETA